MSIDIADPPSRTVRTRPSKRDHSFYDRVVERTLKEGRRHGEKRTRAPVQDLAAGADHEHVRHSGLQRVQVDQAYETNPLQRRYGLVQVHRPGQDRYQPLEVLVSS